MILPLYKWECLPVKTPHINLHAMINAHSDNLQELTIKENALLEQKQHLMDQIEEIEANIKLAKKKTDENKKYTQQKDEDKFRIQVGERPALLRPRWPQNLQLSLANHLPSL